MAERLAELGVVGAGERLAERLENLQRGLMVVSEKANNLPRPSEVFGLNKYLNGRVAIVADLKISPSEAYRVAAYSCPVEREFNAWGFDYRVVSQLGDANCGDEQVVLLPISQVIEGAKNAVPPGLKILVRFYDIAEQKDKLAEDALAGFRFKNLRDQLFCALPIGSDRDSTFALRKWVYESFDAHVAEVGTGPKVVADIARETIEADGDGLGQSRAERIASVLRIGCDLNGVWLFVDEGSDLTVQILDQYVGPYDLKGSVSEREVGLCNVGCFV